MNAYSAAATKVVGWKRYMIGMGLAAFLALLGIWGAIVMGDLVPLLMLVLAAVVVGGVLQQRSKDVRKIEEEMALRYGRTAPAAPAPQTPSAPTHTRYKITVPGRSRDDILTEIRTWVVASGGIPVADFDYSRYTNEQRAQLASLGQGAVNGTEYLIQAQIGLDPNRRILADLAKAHPDWVRGSTPEETERIIAQGQQHPEQLVPAVLGRHPEWSVSEEGSRISAESLSDLPRVFTILTRQEPPGSGPYIVYAAGCVVVGQEQKPFLESPSPTESYRRKGWDEMTDLRQRLEPQPPTPPAGTKTCAHCGQALSDAGLFCARCGWPVS